MLYASVYGSSKHQYRMLDFSVPVLQYLQSLQIRRLTDTPLRVGNFESERWHGKKYGQYKELLLDIPDIPHKSVDK